MRFTPLLLVFLSVALLIAPVGNDARAQKPDDQTLHVLHAALHTEEDKAELCLEFDHTLDASGHARAQAAFRLESDGKYISILPENFSITSTFFCLSQLDYGKDYSLSLSHLRGLKNEELAEPYDASFTIPKRRPSLAIAGDNNRDGLMRWKDNAPSLRSVNVAEAHVELYRLTALDDMMPAWLQRRQTALAPSESAYLARSKGTLIWQGDMTFEGSPNLQLEQKISLPDAPVPGLYLVIASAPDVKINPSQSGLAPLAAAWLLRSALEVHAVHDASGFYAFAETAEGPAAGIHVTVLDQDRHVLAEGKSSGDGVTFMPMTEDKQVSAVALVGQSPAGDVYFADPHDSKVAHPVLSSLEALINIPQSFYAPGASVDAALSARDIHGHAVAIMPGGVLQILRSDRSLYTRISVPADVNGTIHMSIPAPATDGLWPLVWQAAGGDTYAETTLRVTPNPLAPRLMLEADRSILSGDNDVTIKITGVTKTDMPAPYIAGDITVSWATPAHVFPGWEDYRFGDGETSSTPAQTLATFLTDQTGKAQIHLKLKVPSSAASLRAAVINVRTDPASGAANPGPLLLPFSPLGVIIGIKPLAAGDTFAENGLAKFSVIALNAEGKRADADNLSFQIYDEGRSFEWYQAEGRWDYKPLQQSRRIGGKPLILKAQGDNVIEWPVTAGTYRLDITDINGNVLSRMHFNAGWDLPQSATPAEQLELTASPETLHVGEATHVHFTLTTPSMIDAFIADDHIRKVIHRLASKGDNDITFVPEKDWGDRILIYIQADDTNDAGKIVLPLPQNTLKAEAVSGVPLPALSLTEWTPPVLTVGDTFDTEFELKNNTVSAGLYQYALSAASLKITGGSGAITLAAGQQKNIFFTARTVSPGNEPLKLEITGPHGFHLNHAWPMQIYAPQQYIDQAREYTLPPEQSWPSTEIKPQSHRGSEFLLVAPEPLLDAPSILALALSIRPIQTTALADRLEMLRLWHDEAVSSGLVPEPNFSSLREETLLRLLQRQKPDGSFPKLPGTESDLISTAAAVMALTHTGEAKAQPAVDQAASWLQHKLENTWFDEHERPARASVYAMLAAADKTDTASLHYFSDTSTDKSVPALAAVQLAAAFAKINDRDKALYWLGRAQIEKGTANIDPVLLPYLAENAFFEPHDLAAAMKEVATKIISDPASRALTGLFLRALAAIEQRAGGWRVTLNGAIKNANGILALSVGEKPPVLANPNNNPIFIADVVLGPTAKAKKTADIVRHIYRLDETALGNGPFRMGDVYVIALEGPWPEEQGEETIMIKDDPGPGFASIGCALDGNAETGEGLTWIKNLALTSLQACEKPERSVLALLTRKGDNAKSWRIAYLTKAQQAGTFASVPARVYLEDGIITEETARGPAKIRQ